MNAYTSWLEVIGQMVPNTRSVVVTFVDNHNEREGDRVVWPHESDVDELVSFLEFSIAQKSSSTSVISGAHYRIAQPVLSATKEIICYLGIEVDLAGGSPESIKRVVEWSALWFGLLLQQELVTPQASHPPPAAVTDERPNSNVTPDSFDKGTRSFKSFLTRYKYVIVFSLCLIVLAIPVDYRISVNAVIEGEVEAPVIAPFDGYIKTASFKAGDLVDKDSVLAELDERDIALKWQKLNGERQEVEKSYRQALASGERGKAEVLKAKMAQLSAQIETVQLALNKTELRSRIAGVVIAGDLSRSIGVPVTKGDVLFKIAPVGKYRTILRIKETDIRFMKAGLNADLKLASLPSRAYLIELHKPSPFFSDENNEIVYLAEATLQAGFYDELRPGMEGIAKVNVGSYSLAWGLFHHFSDWLRMQFWAIQP